MNYRISFLCLWFCNLTAMIPEKNSSPGAARPIAIASRSSLTPPNSPTGSPKKRVSISPDQPNVMPIPARERDPIKRLSATLQEIITETKHDCARIRQGMIEESSIYAQHEQEHMRYHQEALRLKHELPSYLGALAKAKALLEVCLKTSAITSAPATLVLEQDDQLLALLENLDLDSSNSFTFSPSFARFCDHCFQQEEAPATIAFEEQVQLQELKQLLKLQASVSMSRIKRMRDDITDILFEVPPTQPNSPKTPTGDFEIEGT